MVDTDGRTSDMSRRIPWRGGGGRPPRMRRAAPRPNPQRSGDRGAISLIALVPAVQILLFGYAVNLDPKSVPIAIAGGDDAAIGRAARIAVETGYFTIVGEGLPSGTAERMVIDGKALVGIELPRPHIEGSEENDIGP